VQWFLIGGVAAGFALLAGRSVLRRKSQLAVADASGLVPVRDLSHLPDALQRTALWALGDGGFEERVVHGVISRGTEDIDVTAFELETLRDRRGEWAYLPVTQPFRIGGSVSIVVCQLDRAFPHVLFKRRGVGDALADDDALERTAHLAKFAREALQVARSYPAELPRGLAAEPLEVALPAHWRAYGTDAIQLQELLAGGLARALARSGHHDLVIELIDSLVVVYPATRLAVAANAMADLTAVALELADAVLVASPRLSPRGVE
jgi:hypothetical protein